MNLEQLTQKKAQLDALLPMPKAAEKNLLDWLTVELTYSSNALEGNTLTRMETAQVIEKGISIAGKTVTEHLEAKNHAEALAYVRKLAGIITQVTEEHILAIHARMLHAIDDAHAGIYRSVPVRIAGSTSIMPNHVKLPKLMTELEEWLAACPHGHPVEDAAMAHYTLVSIHPFVDGNGRTARLLMNLMLWMHGYPPAVIDPAERVDYLNVLEHAQTGGSIEPYMQFIYKTVATSLDSYLQTAKDAQG